MIKLRQILEDARPLKGKGLYDVAYHVAEEDARDSIEKYGLDPTKYNLNDRTTVGKYIYVFADYDDADVYIGGYNSFLRMQDESEKTFDIWKINTKNLMFIKDYTLNAGDNPEYDSAYILKAPVDGNY